MKFTLIVVVLTNLAYWFFLFAKLLANRNDLGTGDSNKSVSLIVCIKNGIHQLSSTNSLLKTLKKTDELILVDDFSTDGTLGALHEINDERVRVISAKIDQKGKKMALQEGIAQARYDVLVFTDIDCIPSSDNWIQYMRTSVDHTSEIVLGYGAYKKKSGFLNAFIRHETLMTAMQYMSYAISGFPYMGVGRNLAYSKQLFENSNKFESHKDLASGDDDLFISEVATKENTSISMHPESFTLSEPATSWGGLLKQKSRHITTASRYKWKTKILLSLYTASHILCYVLPLVLLFFGEYTFAILAFTLRFGLSWLIYSRIASKFEEEDLGKAYPLLDLGMIIYYIVLSPFLMFQRKEW